MMLDSLNRVVSGDTDKTVCNPDSQTGGDNDNDKVCDGDFTLMEETAESYIKKGLGLHPRYKNYHTYDNAAKDQSKLINGKVVSTITSADGCHGAVISGGKLVQYLYASTLPWRCLTLSGLGTTISLRCLPKITLMGMA